MSSHYNLAKSFVPVVILLFLFGFMVVSSMLRKSATFDEPLHLAAGYSYWTQNEYRFSTENGNLAQRWAALPLLFGSYHFPEKMRGGFRVGFAFLFSSGNDARAILMQGRAMIVVLGIALGVLVYAWSSELFGRLGGLLSLTLYCFSPAILAHTRLATSDLTVALFFTLAIWCVWKLLHKVTLASVIGTALAIGALLVAKMSGLLLLPMAFILIIIRLISSRPTLIAFGEAKVISSRSKQMMVFVALVLVQVVLVTLIVRGFYGFRFTARKTPPVSIEAPTAEKPEAEPGEDEKAEKVYARPSQMPALFHSLLDFARRHHLLPEAYLRGLDIVARHSLVRPAFFNGRCGAGGWHWFFPYCFLVKTPLPLFLILFLGFLGAAVNWLTSSRERQQPLLSMVANSFYQTSPLWVLLFIYWAMAVNTTLNIGERHILPVYPATFILAGAAAFWLKRRYLVPAIVMLAATFFFMLESVRIWPNYLAYFNQIAGGPQNGYKHLVDSNLDWGQDLPSLAAWLAEEKAKTSDDPRVYLAYFGSSDPGYYGINAERLPGHLDLDVKDNRLDELRAGYYCISATMLQMVHLRPMGHWTVSYENAYQSLLSFSRLYQHKKVSLNSLEKDLRLRLEWYQELRFARLCAFLRQRRPDHSLGYSILVYRLTDDDLNRALFMPPVEIYNDDPNPEQQ